MNGAKGCVEFLPGLRLTFMRACPHMAWPSSGQRQRVDPCPQSLQGLEIPGRSRLCIPAPSKAVDLLRTPRPMAVQTLVPAGLGPASHLAPTPLPTPVFPSLWVLC